ncbi:hypothetical protein [Bradyrhizobium sp. RT10b]|uniref:hypothetical protein n=1 Tax=Bradyrhizobium sp. RT10b TaxID=3156331 RepID=UPI0033923A31
MRKSIKVDQKSKRGRPATGRDPMVSSRIPAEIVAAVDQWAAKNETTRSDAIKQLVELGLTVKAKSRAKSEDAQQRQETKQRARELAGDTINEITDKAASPDDQASRKRRLVKGPEEFQNVRRDRPNRK